MDNIQNVPTTADENHDKPRQKRVIFSVCVIECCLGLDGELYSQRCLLDKKSFSILGVMKKYLAPNGLHFIKCDKYHPKICGASKSSAHT